ncbi:unnamed protein product [Lepeophtheirus salmonis]|uniref:(salmon louse) hypothetical protein n=1 Tax=Lepeophtheirus salmonis TaxID=72036 RepID=A0A7R8H4T8_LEPSM|nr:unnamed protein product [Lepeophtheirus salmonis]CAF2853875.1 unnamed protein product [Lepeophtheirus salmonis]
MFIGFSEAAEPSLKDINALTLEEITAFMSTQFDTKFFTVHERFKYSKNMKRNSERQFRSWQRSPPRGSHLDFALAIKIAVETEDAARVAKDTVYGAKSNPVNKIIYKTKKEGPIVHSNKSRSQGLKCNYCGLAGHLEKSCKKKVMVTVHLIQNGNSVYNGEVSARLEITHNIQGHKFEIELYTATTGNFLSKHHWEDIFE